MSSADALQLTNRLPLELLEKVLACTSILDILRMKQVGKLYDHAQRLQLNLSNIVSLSRSLVASTISSRSRLISHTGSISTLQGCRTTQTQTFPLPTNARLSTNTAQNGMSSTPLKSGNGRSTAPILIPTSADLAFTASLWAPRSSSSSLAWSLFHEGFRLKSGRSHCPTSSP